MAPYISVYIVVLAIGFVYARIYSVCDRIGIVFSYCGKYFMEGSKTFEDIKKYIVLL